jgi:phosphopantetheine--protein transferase-like protein
MVVYCGIDIVSAARLELHWNDIKGAFSSTEIVHYDMPWMAKRFAVKEAVIKALGGNGASSGIALSEIEVLRLPSGRPYVVLHGGAKMQFDAIKGQYIDVSISDDMPLAVAMCVIEASSP